ncbi:ParB N-terminal domain-containing protein [Ruficoccus amylovorans]|uniref:ParB N-terminal domain-containing protein n=1 Tax=Ruficoccus amylovorans TaxID=1804625 RepID=A0A842HFW3_9BACT|nr:ParB N-terminal domain-containing protein [Ruficoccus amylovorans]MBC2594424.1 ParB N-terminal domain-containing protein [Ruficoccus amylovorans]
MIENDQYYAPSELAKLAEIPKNTVINWVKGDHIPSTSSGEGGARRYQVRGGDFIAFLNSEKAGKHRRPIQDEVPEVSPVPQTPNGGLDAPRSPSRTSEAIPAASEAPAVEPSEAVSEEIIATTSEPLPMASSASPSMGYKEVAISRIIRESECQVREKINERTVSEYAETLKDGGTFPPVILFGTHDGAKLYLADGFHRLFAHERCNRTTITAEIHEGGLCEAIRYALGVNSTHGLRRTSADKRKAIGIALQHFHELSNVAIAELCGVSESSVRNHRESAQNGKRVGRDGKSHPARKGSPSAYRRAKSAITRVKCTADDAQKLIEWLREHFKLAT